MRPASRSLVGIFALVGVIGLGCIIPQNEAFRTKTIETRYSGFPLGSDFVLIGNRRAASEKGRLFLLGVKFQDEARSLESHIEFWGRKTKGMGFPSSQCDRANLLGVDFVCMSSLHPHDLKIRGGNVGIRTSTVSKYKPNFESSRFLANQAQTSNFYSRAVLEDDRVSSGIDGAARLDGLPDNCAAGEHDSQCGDPFRPCYEFVPPLRLLFSVLLIVGGGLIVGYGRYGWRVRLVCGLLALACGILATYLILFGHRYYCNANKNEHRQSFEHGAIIDAFE
jgi:hypothetical protein